MLELHDAPGVEHAPPRHPAKCPGRVVNPSQAPSTWRLALETWPVSGSHARAVPGAEFDVAVDLKAAGATAATVELTGSGSWKGPAALQADGKLHRTLIAAATPGSARIQVRLDGAALLVRPRVRYE